MNTKKANKKVAVSLTSAQLKIVYENLDKIHSSKRSTLYDEERKTTSKVSAQAKLAAVVLKGGLAKDQFIQDVLEFLRQGESICSNGYCGIPVLSSSKTSLLYDRLHCESSKETQAIREAYNAKVDALNALRSDIRLRLALASSYEEVAPLLEAFASAKL